MPPRLYKPTLSNENADRWSKYYQLHCIFYPLIQRKRRGWMRRRMGDKSTQQCVCVYVCVCVCVWVCAGISCKMCTAEIQHILQVDAKKWWLLDYWDAFLWIPKSDKHIYTQLKHVCCLWKNSDLENFITGLMDRWLMSHKLWQQQVLNPSSSQDWFAVFCR